MLATMNDKKKYSEGALPEEFIPGAENRGEVKVLHAFLTGTTTSVSSAVMILSLMVGGIHSTERGFDPCYRANVMEEWRLLQKRTARTPLGMRLMQIRERIVKSGVPLLGWDEIEKEVAERRGETA